MQFINSYKSKLELKSNSSEILPVNSKFIRVYVFLFFAESQDIRTSSWSFVSLSWSRITDKLAIYWQNFARVRLQLKFDFKIGPYC